MKLIQRLFCSLLLSLLTLYAQSPVERNAKQLAEDYIKLRDPARVDELKKFPPEQSIPAYYRLRTEAWERSVRGRAELLMMNTPGWDKWFLDQLWSLLPGSLYMPTDKIGDWIYEDPDRFERILKTGDQIRGQRQAADDLIYYLGGLRDPKVIRILGPILFLEGDTFNYIDVSSYPSSERANTSLNDMDIYGLPEMGTLDDTRKWWLKNKDLTDEQWWELLRKGNEEIVKSRPAFDSMGHRNPPPPPRPAPVTPPPVLIPKPITPVPVQRLMPRPSPSTPLRQPQVPQLTSQAAAFWPRWLVVGTVTTGLGWLLLRGADDSPEH